MVAVYAVGRHQCFCGGMICLFGLVLVGCQADEPGLIASDRAAIILPMLTLDPDAVALGQQVYAQYCASCHGVNLEGQADWKNQNEDGSFRSPPHDARWHHTDELLYESVALGGEVGS